MTWVVPQTFSEEKLDLTSHYAHSFRELYSLDFPRENRHISYINHFKIESSGFHAGYILGDEYLWKEQTFDKDFVKLPYYSLQIQHHLTGDAVSLCQSLTAAGCVYAMLLLINTDDSKCILNLNATDVVKSIREMDALWVGQFTSYADVPERFKKNQLQEKDFDALKLEAKNHDGKVEGIKELCAKQLLLDITGRE